MNNSGTFVKEAVNVVWLTLIGTVAWIFILAFLLLGLPMYLYRYVITSIIGPCWSHFRRHDLGKAVDVFGNGCAVEFWTNNTNSPHRPTRCNVVCTIILEGTVSLSELHDAVHRRWIQARDKNSHLLYPEFQQYIDSWMGLMFWKNCKDFKLADHLKTHTVPENQFTMDSYNDWSARFLNDLVESLVNKPFPVHYSPWEIHLIQNYKDSVLSTKAHKLTALVLKFHHGLADGFSMVQAVVEGLFEKNIPLATTTVQLANPSHDSLRSLFKTVSKILLVPLRASYDIGYVGSLYFRNKTPWHVPDSKKSWYQLYEKSNIIPISKVKTIKNKFGVSFTSVLFSCVSATFAKSLRRHHSTKTLDMFPSVTFLPLPGHPKKLTNHFTATIFDLPINPNLDPVTRLISCDKKIEHAKGSMIPFLFARLFAPAILTHLAPVAKNLSQNRTIPSGITSFRCNGFGPLIWNGKSVLACDFVAGANIGEAGVGFMVMSCGDHIRFTATAENAVISREELREMMKWIEEEIELLYSDQPSENASN